MQFIRANRLIAVGFAVVLLALVGNGVWSAWNTYRVADNQWWVAHTHQVEAAIEQVVLAVVDAETGVRGFNLSGREDVLAPYNGARGRAEVSLRELADLTTDNPDQESRVNRMRRIAKERFDLIDKGVATKRADPGVVYQPAAFDVAVAQMRELRQVAAEMRDEENNLLRTRLADARTIQLVAYTTLGLATLLTIGVVLTAFLVMKRDEEARVAAAVQLSELAADNRRILQSTGEGIYGIGTSGACTFLNRAGGQLLGYEPEAVLGKNVHALIHHTKPDGSPYPIQECPIYRVLQTGQGGRVDGEYFYRADGSRFPVEYSSYPIVKDGALTGAVVSFTDATERKKYQDDLLAAKQAAEDANQAKSAFLANMSHELRTPLNAVIMYSELLQEEAADIGQGETFGPDLDRIRGAGKHLLSLVNGVLDLSKIEAGKMELDLETFDLSASVAEVVDTIRPLVEKKGNTLTVDCPPEVGTVHADTTKLRQVLFNLLSNANKFTENGRVTLTVRRVPDPAGDRIALTVVDTGIGMTEEQIGKLFRPFTQADASTTRKYGGTGLGLTISKRFAEMMGGTITVSSVPGAGTTFSAGFPTRVAAVETQPARKTGALMPADAPTMLVIDDDAGVREFMTRALLAQGVRALLAGDGEEGLRLARQHHPAVVFLDVIMPRLDGWAVLAALKGDPTFKDTPVVMMTVVGDQDMGYMLGAADYLQKPIDRDQLATTLAKYRPAPGGRVLVVDDDPATREVLKRALVKDGWLVDEAENGRQALDRVAAGVPALVLLDLLMPEMTGFEFVAELRKNPAWGGIPVVVLTSKDLTPDERQMLSGNVERVMQKGAYSRDALLAEVNKVVAAYGGRPATATKEG